MGLAGSPKEEGVTSPLLCLGTLPGARSWGWDEGSGSQAGMVAGWALGSPAWPQGCVGGHQQQSYQTHALC